MNRNQRSATARPWRRLPVLTSGVVLVVVAGLLLPVKPALAQGVTFLTVDDAGLPEPRDAKSVDLVFLVRLTDTSGLPDPHPFTTVQVGYTTTDGSKVDCGPFACAKAGKDYRPTTGVLTFMPGETSKEIHVPILRDRRKEPNEVFFVLLLTPNNAIFMDPFGLGRITTQTPPRGSASSKSVEEFTNGFIGHPGGMVVGPDGNFWMTEQFDGRLVVFDRATLTATEFPTRPQPPLAGTFPAPLPGFALVHFITRGPDVIGPDIRPGHDSNLWFTTLDDQIGTFDLDTKEFRMFRLVESGIVPFSSPHFIQYAGDGFFYFTMQDEEVFPEPGGQNKSRIGRGRLARFNLATMRAEDFPNALPQDRQMGNRMHGLTIDANGNIWAGLEAFDEVWKFNKTTQMFEGPPIHFPTGSGPHDLMLGPDRKIYVVLQDDNQLGVFDPDTGETEEFKVPGLSHRDGPSLVFMAIGPDNTSIWFSEFLNDRIGRFDLNTHRVTQFYKGMQGGAAPIGLVTGPDGNIWFTEAVPDLRFPGRIGRLIP